MVLREEGRGKCCRLSDTQWAQGRANFASVDSDDIALRKTIVSVGKILINNEQQSGFKTVEWNATNDFGKRVSAGIYFFDLQAGEFRKTRMMVLLK